MHIVRVTVLGVIAAAFMPLVFDASAQSACTKEAKICPDGVTTVGRTGPNCEFEACPGEQAVNCAPYQCKDGTEVARCTDDGHMIYYVAAPCHTNGGEVEVSASFSDVPESHANAEAIAYVKAEGIVEGYADGTFRPDQTINRAEFVKILIESYIVDFMGPGPEECIQDTTYIFPDVHRSLWYAPHLCAARGVGGVEGYPDGLFHGERNINFVEAAKILTNTFELDISTTIAACETSNCPWYRSYVLMLEAHGAIPTSIMSFDQYITRGEMAEMIWRLKTENREEPSRTYEDLEQANNQSSVTLHGVSWVYPSEWGTLIRYGTPPSESFKFSILDERNNYPIEAPELISIRTRAYDSSANRYEIGTGYEYQNEVTKIDLLAQKADIAANATMTIAGYPATFREFYEAPSGYVVRIYTFFTATHRVAIHVGYDISDLYRAEYERRIAGGESPSLAELVAEDLGKNFPDPYEGLRRMYPEATLGMKLHFDQAENIIGGMR